MKTASEIPRPWIRGSGAPGPRGTSGLSGLALALAFLSTLMPPAVPPAGAGDLTIAGERSFEGEVVIPAGETWTVGPGAAVRFRGGRWIVRGRLSVSGTGERPVRIVGDDAFEGIDIRGSAGTSFEHAVIAGGSRGVRITNATAVFRSVRWERNGVGLDVGQYGKATLEGAFFEAPFRVGLLVRRGGSASAARSRFSRAGKAGVYLSGASGVSLADCAFDNNAAGVHAAMPGGGVSLARCVFRGNGTGIFVEKQAAPRVDDCDFSANRTGLHFTKRAAGRVTKSRIGGNGLGVLVEFSSYPVFRGNAFRGNRDGAVRLSHQSSEWEEERGGGVRETGEGEEGATFAAMPGARGDFRPAEGMGAGGGPPAMREIRDGTVDFRGNDWGEASADVERGGPVSAIHDGRIEPVFEDGGKRYRMDRVLLK